ncbi:unnamed protein product [Anisakis simplex]|uniref:Uncharacterized protein n=1 Tax=Anisakis simplex TaxID=6269 RepID=A0A0M3JVN0_ANISI|nr:unnamed protein product [Anisakis simplex]
MVENCGHANASFLVTRQWFGGNFMLEAVVSCVIELGTYEKLLSSPGSGLKSGRIMVHEMVRRRAMHKKRASGSNAALDNATEVYRAKHVSLWLAAWPLLHAAVNV